MQLLWNKEIEDIKNSGYLKKDVSITDALIENFYNEILKPEEQKLLELSFSENPNQKDLDIHNIYLHLNATLIEQTHSYNCF